MGTASAQGVHYCSFDKSQETGPTWPPPSLSPVVWLPWLLIWLAPLCLWLLADLAGSGNMTARAYAPRHGHRQMRMGCRNMYLNAKVQEGCVCLCIVHVQQSVCCVLCMVHVCSQKVYNVCLKFCKHFQSPYDRF